MVASSARYGRPVVAVIVVVIVPPPPVALSTSDVDTVSGSFRGYLFVLIANRDRCVWGVGDCEGRL